jgi:hypothetical protein
MLYPKELTFIGLCNLVSAALGLFWRQDLTNIIFACTQVLIAVYLFRKAYRRKQEWLRIGRMGSRAGG